MRIRYIYPKKLLMIALAVVYSASWLGFSGMAQATYHANRLIDNYPFINSNSMTTSEIQSFLEHKNSYLKNHKFTESCGDAWFDNPYAHCGKSVLASQIIYDTAKAVGLSPRVIMATLQKEESLITDPNPDSSQINFAMGYGCFDSTGCSQYKGFFKQVNKGSWQLRYNYEAVQGNDYSGTPASNYRCIGKHSGFYSASLLPGNTVTFYRASSSFSNMTFKIANAATASLYCYTPHAGPYATTGYSGSYNFVTSYESWWGSTLYDTSKDKVLVGDWDGDGKSTPAIKRGNLYYFDNDNNGVAENSFAWGKPTDKAFVGKWNGTNDGIALKRGNEYFLDYNNNGSSDKYIQWGQATDQVIVGNWYGSAGSGDKLGLKRGSQYFLDWDNNGKSNVSYAWGKDGDQVIVGDWYNSGGVQDKLGLKRGNLLFLDYDNNGKSNASYAWGRSSDHILIGDWDGSTNGREKLGLRRGNQYFIDWDDNGKSNVSYAWGKDSDVSMIGDWDTDGKDSLGLKRASSYFLDYDNNGSSNLSYTYTF